MRKLPQWTGPQPVDIDALASKIYDEFGRGALIMARQLLSTAEGEARENWQRIVAWLAERTEEAQAA